MFADEWQKVWANCLDDICAAIKDEDSVIRDKFRRIHLESFTKDTGMLRLQIPDNAFYQWLESDTVIKFFYGFVVKHFGRIAKLEYRIANSEQS